MGIAMVTKLHKRGSRWCAHTNTSLARLAPITFNGHPEA